MKKNKLYYQFINTVLIVCILISPLFAGKISAQSDLLFDMDLSAYNEDNHTGIGNKVQSGTLEMTVKKGTVGDISLKSFVNTKSETVRYLEMTKGSVGFTSDDFNNRISVFGLELANTSYTLEAWVSVEKNNQDYTTFARVYGKDASDSTVNSAVLAFTSASYWQLEGKPASTVTSTLPYSGYSHGDWMHITLVRDISPDGSGMTRSYYFNGVKQGETTVSGINKNESTAGFIIGGLGSSTSGNTYATPIVRVAGAKIYRGASSADSIRSHYEDERTVYVEAQLPSYDVEFKDTDGEVIPHIGSRKQISISASAVNSSDSVTFIAAGYKDDEQLVSAKKINVNEATVFDVNNDISYIKVYCWDEDTLTPLRKPEILNRVDKASIVDVILVAGQSNALGQGGNASESIRPEPDTVYYNTMGNNTLATSGNQGWASALGKTWHDETGHTVLIVKATWGGTGFPTQPNIETGIPSVSGSSAYGYWNPGNSGSTTSQPYDCYNMAKNLYNTAVASIDTDKYTIGDCIYFWNQGENENSSYTPREYEEAFLELHNKFITEFGTEDTRPTLGGILPVRSPYSSGFPNLKLTGPRIAQYKMARERDDIHIVSDVTEHWYSDLAIKEWFANAYKDKLYPLDDMPDSWDDIMNTDNVHYKQAAMNEMGIQAAMSMLSCLDEADSIDGIDLITPNGIKHYLSGDTIYLDDYTDTHPYTADGVIPVVSVGSGVKAEFVLSGESARMDENGVIYPAEGIGGYSTLTVKTKTSPDMVFKVCTTVKNDLVSIAKLKDNLPALCTITTDDNYAQTTEIIDNYLEEYDLSATMGLVTDYMGRSGKLTWEEAIEYVNSGRWGVASHTKSHRQSDFASLTKSDLDTEINDAVDILRNKFPTQKIVGMYTPGGITSTLIEDVVKENHLVLRRATGGMNNIPTRVDDMLSLNVYGIGGFAVSKLETMNSWVDDAVENGLWLCEMWHGVGDTDGASWGGNISETTASEHLKYISENKKQGKLWVTTLDEAAIYIAQMLSSEIYVIEATEEKCVFELFSPLDENIYETSLTVNIKIPSQKNIEGILQGEKSLEYKITDNIVSFNADVYGDGIVVSYK